MKRLIAILLLLAPDAASAMSAVEFMARWNVVSKQGKAGAQSPDLPILFREIGAAAKQYRAQIKSAQAENRVPRACPPKRISVTTDDLILEFAKLPPASQAGELSNAFAEVMDRRYPCPVSRAAPARTPST
jgi:hypothetical protein